MRAEERADRNAEHLGDLCQPAGADAVHALLVFLNLLKCHAELLRERGLRQATLQSLDTNPLPNLDVDGVGLLRCHHCFFLDNLECRKPLTLSGLCCRATTVACATPTNSGRRPESKRNVNGQAPFAKACRATNVAG